MPIRTRRPTSRSSFTTSVVGPTKWARPWNRSTPAFAQPCSVSSGTGSVNVRLNRMSSGQSIASSRARTPHPAMFPTASTASAALTRTFLGLQPLSAQVPPKGRESTTATLHPASRQREATADATPVPTTTRSYCRSTIIRLLADRMGGATFARPVDVREMVPYDRHSSHEWITSIEGDEPERRIL